MKSWFSRSMVASLVGFACAWTAASAATLTVTPSAVSNTYSGKLTLQVGGLNNGESVRVRKYADANANGILDAEDVQVQGFRLTDGVAATVAGVTNINVPCDYTPTNGTIVAPIDFQAGGVGQAMAGQYLYVVSSPTAAFTPVTNVFNVTNGAYAQSITGTVRASGTNVPYASILLFTPPVGDGGMDFITGALANSNGDYSISAPVGAYFLMVSKAGYVADMSMLPVVPLGPGATVTTNLTLVPGTRTVSGRMVDAATTNGLGAALVVCEGSAGLAIGFTDTNGNFSIPVTAGQWELSSDDQQATFYGYLRTTNRPSADTTSGDVSGLIIAVPRFTALIYGRVKDTQNNPLAHIGLYAQQNNGSGPYESDTFSDQNGNYSLGVVGGNWQASLDSDQAAFANYIFTRMEATNISAGQAFHHDFVAILATNYITGYVRDGAGLPITNLGVYATATIGTNTFETYSETDISGNYALKVASGSWNIGVDCYHLSQLGLNCPGGKTTNVLNANVVVNFTVSDLAVTTTSLPDATLGVSYSQSLSASGGQPPYTWSFAFGFTNIGFDLSLSTNGVVSGTPTGFGQTSFGVQVTDSLGATAEQFVSLNVNPAPLQITTVSLPNGTNGQYYDFVLDATGGNPPYSWYLPNGSMNLPPGMNLNPNGTLYGTPTPVTNGTFNFNVAVYVNNPYQAVTQALSLTIVPAGLHITTTSPLPSATRNSFYTTTLMAEGGQPPYQWSLAPSSPSLPAGLSLSTNGVLAGTPLVAGGFWFIARVTDSVLATNEWMLGLAINEPPVPGLDLTGPKQPAPGQFQFSFSTSTGTNYTIEYSSDLKTWTSVLTIGGSGGPLTVIDPNANVPQRFYRVKIEP